jgi:hypothetical protein
MNTKCHEATLRVKFLVISVTLHRPNNKINDVITNVTIRLTVELPNVGTNSSFMKYPIFATSDTCVYDVE